MDEEWQNIVDARRDRVLRGSRDPPPFREWKLRRVAAADFSASLSRELVEGKVPFVVEKGLEFCPTHDENVWLYLERVVGSRQVPVERHNQPHDIMPLRQLIAAVQRDDCDLYGYDIPVKRRLNALLTEWRVPRFFCEPDFLKKTRLPHPFDNWPTLFIGAKGTQSATHVDRWHGDFWMVQIAGRKRWTIWPESEMHLLRPSWTNKFDPAFPPVQELRGVGSPIEIVLEPGELLFVPGGTPHAVENFAEPVVAMAGNFVTRANLERVLGDLQLTQVRYADDQALFEALSEIDFDSDDELITSNDPLMDLYE